MASGQFIAIEGGEGTGKSRLLTAIGGHVESLGREVLLTREPGGTGLGERIRALVLSHRAVDDPLAELLLFEAARAHLTSSVIRPALERGVIVLCDRFEASSTAYQGYGRGLGRDIVERANAVATGGLTPDITLLLDAPVDVGLARRAREGGSNHFDSEAAGFHERVRAGFLELARENAGTWVVIDAARPFESVLADAIIAIGPILGLRS